MTSSLLFTTIILVILFIVLDVVLYRLRVERRNAGKPLFASVKNFIVHSRRSFASYLKSVYPADKVQVDIPSSEAADINNSPSPVSTIIDGDSVQLQVLAQIPEGTTVHITLEIVDSTGKTSSQKSTLVTQPPTAPSIESVSTVQNQDSASVRSTSSEHAQRRTWWSHVKTLPHGILQSKNLNGSLLVAALVVYALVISLGIDRYPIYFFTDEAIHMNMASDFLRDHFQNYDHEFLPAFFITEGWVNGTSVYVQVLPYLLFGKSIIATRLVSATITLAGAFALGLFLKQIYKIKYYWVGVLLLLTTPAWFLHARTAFEYAELASFYSIFLYFYSRYRSGHLPSLYPAMIAGALTFYTHGLGQILMGVTGIALIIVDFRYHFHPDHRRLFLPGLGLALLLLLPFTRYYLAHSGESLSQIERRGSYWTNDNLTLFQKTWEFISQYTYGLNPLYWYFHNSVDIDRHIMKGYGNGLWITFPFAAIGFIRAIRNLHLFPQRIAILAFLAAPIPASIVAVGMPRMLWMTISLTIFTAVGLSYCLEQLELRWKDPSSKLPLATFAILTSLSVFMLGNALVNGPTWFEDYSLYGMQYGAKQVFQETIVPDLEKDPDLIYMVSPSWANGTEKFVDFFVPDVLHSRLSLGRPIDQVNTLASITSDTQLIISTGNEQNIVHLTPHPINFTSNLHFVVTSDEYNDLLEDPKFKDITVYKIIPYPNGKPGFYVISLNVVDNIGEIIATEKAKKRTPVEDTLQLDDQVIRVLHSPFESGDLKAVFDHDPNSLTRVLEANPFTFDLYPTTPMDTHGMNIQTGSLPNFTVTVSLYAPQAIEPIIYTKSFKDLPPDPFVSMDFDKGPGKSVRIYIEIKDNLTGNSSQIHVRTIEFR